ncbi:hypothetical protein HAX54_006475, partial [Datura stramonium]|nr:hypothetical protein [Datura stramonium]
MDVYVMKTLECLWMVCHMGTFPLLKGCDKGSKPSLLIFAEEVLMAFLSARARDQIDYSTTIIPRLCPSTAECFDLVRFMIASANLIPWALADVFHSSPEPALRTFRVIGKLHHSRRKHFERVHAMWMRQRVEYEGFQWDYSR